MNEILYWFNKKKFLGLSFFGFFIFLFSYILLTNSDFCFYKESCYIITESFAVYTMLFISMFLFSLLTFKLKQETYNAWRNFSFFYLLVFLILLSFIPMRTHGLDYLPITKGLVSFLLSIIYSIVSLFIVIYHSIKK